MAALRARHKSPGALLLGFGAWRVISRLARGFPVPAAAMPRPPEALARALHWALLAAVVMPLSGVLMAGHAGRAVEVSGVLSIPAAEVDWAAGAPRAVQGVVGKLLAVLVALHVSAALKTTSSTAAPRWRA